ncbi:transporter, SSS family, putative [Synechococcus sp. PCC 7335]|uniref:sodium:solute symporter family transporter n=1 Tax=Synechococcus sp. (strain ATCC 29403 / PCC 7335) TaxID=91464 RepID=UPI00017EBBB7|nr:transporter, SSS family, putative [Synechococcus sp. PCC 7335]EDX85599.1 transporter, SSS family, putative [Synechococcus sp. PCC 7335]
MGLNLLILLVATATFALLGLTQVGKRSIDLEDYMVSRNQIGGPMALATITASALGAWILFSPAEAGSTFGGLSAILGYCIGSAAAVFMFFFVGPRLRQIMPWGHSLNEYVRYRFGQPIKQPPFEQPLGQSSPGQPSSERTLSDHTVGERTPKHTPNQRDQTASSNLWGQAMYLLTVSVMLLYMFVYLAAELTAIAQVLQLVANVPLLVTSLVVIAAVFIYTTYGGLKVTILTDAAQFILIVPLLLICFIATVASLGGWSGAFGPVAQDLPAFLSLGNLDGLRFGATLMIAIIAAELFNQGNWQRVYACKDDQTVRRAFLGSALVILPLLFLSGLLGIIAAGFDLSGTTAFFDLLQALEISGWLLGSIVLLAVALVMSSLDTLLNGISAVFTVDLLRLSRQPAQVLMISRILTVAVGLLAVPIAAQGYSVLYLFFVADLICAALLFPIVFSLYNRYQSASDAFISSVIGIAIGAMFFPKPDFSPIVAIPGGGDLLNSFAAALFSSALITLLCQVINKRFKRDAIRPFNYSDLAQVKPYH